MKKIWAIAISMGLMVAAGAEAGPIRDRLKERRESKATAPVAMARDAVTINYGPDKDQTFDLYLPDQADKAPILIMVHGGGWKRGDKTSARTVENKRKYWGGKGYIFVSVNYRMIPEADPFVQAQDVARAIAMVQVIAAQYKGDPQRIVTMGHSAGGHLVALLAANPSMAAKLGAKRWQATVVLDAGALDVAALMKKRHNKLFDDAFGADPAFWAKASPMDNIKADAISMMLVCALRRPDDSCGESKAFAEKLKTFGQTAPVVAQNLTHGEVNEHLGLPSDYTKMVDAFITSQLSKAP